MFPKVNEPIPPSAVNSPSSSISLNTSKAFTNAVMFCLRQCGDLDRLSFTLVVVNPEQFLPVHFRHLRVEFVEALLDATVASCPPLDQAQLAEEDLPRMGPISLDPSA